MRLLRAIIFVLGVLSLVSAGARAADPPPLRVDVEIGFDGVYRAGRWTPVFLTLQGREPRAVLFEMRVPHDRINAMQIMQAATVSADATTYALFAPAPHDLSAANVVIRDANSGLTLADASLEGNPQKLPRAAGPSDIAVGYSGSGAAPTIEIAKREAGNVLVGAIAPARLPATPFGYDGLDVLLLGAVDLTRVSVEQQSAIADWVRAGGTLVLWPGSAPLPPGEISPIVALLPAEVGDNSIATVDEAARSAFELPDRFAQLPIRALKPREGAKTLDGIGTAAAYSADRGLGHVAVLPFDPTTIAFGSDEARAKFWRPIFVRVLGIGRVPAIAAEEVPENFGVGVFGVGLFREAEEISGAISFAGDIPGIGNFSFGYVLLVLVGMMLIVGPIDWFVLKKLGRQPWTVYTTIGWIALITFGALYLGRLIRSGDLHLRTLEIVDQAGDRVLGRRQIAIVYSPRTTTYELATIPETWWRPASTDRYYSSRSTTLLSDMPFRQAARANLPLPLTIPVWSLRFLHGEHIGDEAPWIESDLSLSRIQDNVELISGTITNRTDFPIERVRFATGDRVASVEGNVQPGATMRVESRLMPAPGSPANTDWSAFFEVQSGREHLMVRQAKSDRDDGSINVIVRATSTQSAGAEGVPLGLSNKKPIERHTRVLRAIVQAAAGGKVESERSR